MILFVEKKKLLYHYTNIKNNYSISFYSSIGQLNFFHWAIHNKIIDYIKDNISDISYDMKNEKKMKKMKTIINNDPENRHEINDNIDYNICSSNDIKKIYIKSNHTTVNKKNKKHKKHNNNIIRYNNSVSISI